MRPPMTDDELMHFGILGMKWGVRRYQNPDGSLTSAGEARYGKKPGFLTKYKNKKKMAKVRAAKKAKEKKGNDYDEPTSKIKDFSDKELMSRVDRLNKEKEYKRLMNEVRHPAKSAVKKALGEVGTKLLKDAATKVGEHYLDQFLKSHGVGTSQSSKIDKQLKNIELQMKQLNLQEKQFKVNDLLNNGGKKKKKKKNKG